MKELTIKAKDLQFKNFTTKVEDVTDQGIVVFYAAIFANVDRNNEVCDKGCFKKTIKENFDEIFHYKNHGWMSGECMPGVLTELKEDDIGLLCVSQLIMDTQIGSETFAQYKAMKAAGKQMRHSIGYIPIKAVTEDAANRNSVIHLKEVYLGEVSTLTRLSANKLAGTIDVKSADGFSFDEFLAEEAYFNELLNAKFSDMKLAQLEKIRDHFTSLVKEASRISTSIFSEPTSLIEALKYTIQS